MTRTRERWRGVVTNPIVPSCQRELKNRLESRKMRPNLRRFRRGVDAAYSTNDNLADAAGSTGADGPSLTGSGFDEFDRRLRDAAADKGKDEGSL